MHAYLSLFDLAGPKARAAVAASVFPQQDGQSAGDPMSVPGLRVITGGVLPGAMNPNFPQQSAITVNLFSRRI